MLSSDARRILTGIRGHCDSSGTNLAGAGCSASDTVFPYMPLDCRWNWVSSVNALQSPTEQGVPAVGAQAELWEPGGRTVPSLPGSCVPWLGHHTQAAIARRQPDVTGTWFLGLCFSLRSSKVTEQGT